MVSIGYEGAWNIMPNAHTKVVHIVGEPFAIEQGLLPLNSFSNG